MGGKSSPFVRKMSSMFSPLTPGGGRDSVRSSYSTNSNNTYDIFNTVVGNSELSKVQNEEELHLDLPDVSDHIAVSQLL